MKYKFIILFSIFMCIQTICFAESVKVERRATEGTYIISGIIEEAAVNQKVIISVKDKTGNIVYLLGVDTAADGEFNATIKLDNISNGDYDLYVGAYDLGVPIDKNIFYTDSSDVLQVFEEVNDIVKAGGSIISAIDSISSSIPNNTYSNAKILGLDSSYYSSMNTIGKTEIENILKINQQYADVDDLNDKFYTALAIAVLGNANSTNIKNIINDFETIYNFDSCVTYPLFEKLNQNNDNVINVLVGTKLDSIPAIQNKFNEKIVLEGIRCSKNIGEAKEIYQTYQSLFDFSSFVNWSIERIAQETAGKTYESYSVLYSTLQTSYDSEMNGNNNSSNNSNNNGAGGFGGGSAGDGGLSMGAFPTQSIPTVQEYSFEDIADYRWAVDSIEFLHEKNIINGYGDGKFYPEKNITREEFLVIVLKALGLDETGYSCDFVDVEEGYWAREYVATAYNKKIIYGIGDGVFGIGHNITRQDMAVIINRAVTVSNHSIESIREEKPFDDNEMISDYAQESIAVMYKGGIINGYDDGTFKPQNSATRAEVACMVAKILQ